MRGLLRAENYARKNRDNFTCRCEIFQCSCLCVSKRACLEQKPSPPLEPTVKTPYVVKLHFYSLHLKATHEATTIYTASPSPPSHTHSLCCSSSSSSSGLDFSHKWLSLRIPRSPFLPSLLLSSSVSLSLKIFQSWAIPRST